MQVIHKTRPIKVWADIDIGIAKTVEYLNTISGVRTFASCQGTIEENGPNPYKAYVLCTWTNKALKRLKREFNVVVEGINWGYITLKEQK